MLTCLHFQAVFLDIFGPREISIFIWGPFLVRWCFVFQHLGKTSVFTRGFPFEFGLRCSGALFFSIWRSSVFDFFGSFDVVLDGLWAPRLWSGRSGPGTVFFQFLGSPLWVPKWSPGCYPNTQKQTVFRPFMRKG